MAHLGIKQVFAVKKFYSNMKLPQVYSKTFGQKLKCAVYFDVSLTAKFKFKSCGDKKIDLR